MPTDTRPPAAEADDYGFVYAPPASDHYSTWPLVGMCLVFAAALAWAEVRKVVERVI